MPQPYLRPAAASAQDASGGADIESLVVSRLQQSELFRRYQQAFETTIGLPLVLRAAGSFLAPLQGSQRVNPFCALMTQANQTCAACLRLQQRVEEEAALEAKTLQCYAGLHESAVPVRVGNRVLAYLQTGQVLFRAPSKKQFTVVARVIREGNPGADPHELESAYFRTRVVTRRQYESIIRLLAIFAEHLATVSNQILIAEATAEPPQIRKARTFIAEHQSERLCLGDVARAANMSSYYFCKIFKMTTGVGLTEYIARGRIESVKQMLLNVQTHVGDAGYAAGFQSLSQFNRTFHRVAGEAPSAYRNRLHGLKGNSIHKAVLVQAELTR